MQKGVLQNRNLPGSCARRLKNCSHLRSRKQAKTRTKNLRSQKDGCAAAERPLDVSYAGFINLVAGQIAASVASARAYGAEKKRAEGLAEIDRAKTAFFSNVSHEFRTPLTLMLGPLQDLLARSQTHLSPTAKEQLDLVSRNGSRLLRLVNTLPAQGEALAAILHQPSTQPGQAS